MPAAKLTGLDCGWFNFPNTLVCWPSARNVSSRLGVAHFHLDGAGEEVTKTLGRPKARIIQEKKKAGTPDVTQLLPLMLPKAMFQLNK